MANEFGEFLKKKRLEMGISLRSLADQVPMAASYLSDIEKGRRYAPEMEKLSRIAKLLEIQGDERDIFFDLAGKSKDKVAPDLPDYIRENEKVKLLLRKVRSARDSEKKLDKIIRMLEQEE